MADTKRKMRAILDNREAPVYSVIYLEAFRRDLTANRNLRGVFDEDEKVPALMWDCQYACMCPDGAEAPILRTLEKETGLKVGRRHACMCPDEAWILAEASILRTLEKETGLKVRRPPGTNVVILADR